MDEFWTGLTEGEIHFRDNLQFELKTEFAIDPTLQENIFKQEFFFFIPNTMQINPNTYSKEQFYTDQTNLIRYKTPRFYLDELLRSKQRFSPLEKLQALQNTSTYSEQTPIVVDELKLFANIFRSALRNRIQDIVMGLEKPPFNSQFYQEQIQLLCTEIEQVRQHFWAIQKEYQTTSFPAEVLHTFSHVDEFLSRIIDFYLTRFLQKIRSLNLKEWSEIDNKICHIILQEKFYRDTHYVSPHDQKSPFFKESILYRNGLLSKFILESLSLKINRRSLQQTHGNLFGSIAAGIAMLIYMILFVALNIWLVNFDHHLFIFEVSLFILLVVFFYIIKDRIKEGLKSLSYKHAVRWFSDYSTEIESQQGYRVGQLKETFSFIEEKDLPPGFLNIRNKDYHEELPALKRHETIIYYKREVSLFAQSNLEERRRKELTTIFRLNIQRFLLKASNPYLPDLTLDPETLQLVEGILPKVYHLNIIIRNTYIKPYAKEQSEIKKFRVVVDKTGIKRVEQVN